jgi:dipeptidyl aminopeptidase/acylaminoacyl peptidase
VAFQGVESAGFKYYRTADPKDEGIIIVKRDLASGEEKELIRRKYMLGRVSLSPDGRYIGMVASNDPSGSPSTLIIIPSAGGPPRELIHRSTIGAVNFSPDGRYVATRTTDPATKSNAVLLIPIDGGEARELMGGPESHLIVVAAWAPDSRSVLLQKSSRTWDESELWRVPLNGSGSQKLEVNIDIAGGILPSPDGRHVAFQTPQSEKKPTEIWVTENFLPTLTASK